MAEAAPIISIGEIKEHFLHCEICEEEFESKIRVPHYLPCLHSFCLVCLKKIWNDGSSTLACPKCRKECQVKDTIEDSFPVDFVSMRFVEFVDMKKKSTDISCTDCPAEAKAIHYCWDCQHYMCDACLRYHNKFVKGKDHEILPVVELAKSPTKLYNTLETCPHHEGSKLELFCENDRCQKPICSSCAIVDHKERDGHNVRHLQGIYDMERSKLVELAAKLQDNQNHYQNCIDSLNNQKSELQSTRMRVTEEIEKEFAKISTALTESKKQLLYSLDTTCDRQQRKIDKQLETLVGLVLRKDEALNYLEQVKSISRPAEFLTLKTPLQNKIVSLLEEEVVITSESHVVSFNHDSSNIIMKAIGNFKITSSQNRRQRLDSIKGKAVLEVDDCVAGSASCPVKIHLGDTDMNPKRTDPQRIFASLSDQPETRPKQINAVYNEDEKVFEIKVQLKIEGRYTIHIQVDGADLNKDGYTFECHRASDSGMSKSLHLPPKSLNNAGTDIVIQCPSISFSKDKVTANHCFITDQGCLVNQDISLSRVTSNNLWGTVGSVSLTGHERIYWQMNSNWTVNTDKTGPWIFEAGILQLNGQKNNVRICTRSRGCCVVVTTCSYHSKICSKLFQNGLVKLDVPMCARQRDTPVSLSFGFLLDLLTHRLYLIDSQKKTLIYTFENVDTSEPLFPAFALSLKQYGDVSMKLVTGSDLKPDEGLLELLGAIYHHI